MNALLATPLELRLLVLFVCGAALGSLLNLAIYRLSWEPRWISPWRREPKRPTTGWPTRLPIVGWWLLRHETVHHGARFWIRPLLIELTTGLLLAGLYWWEIDEQGLLIPPLIAPLAPMGNLAWTLHAEYGAQAILIAFMIVASWIDVDERIIPDSVTIPGTLLGLTLATLVPQSLLPDVILNREGAVVTYLHAASPNDWPAMLVAGQVTALAVGLGCYWLWCAGLLPRRWRARRGVVWAWRLFWARLARERFTLLVFGLAAVGSVLIAAVWWWGGDAWRGLASALIGLAAGGGLVWAVRFVGTSVLGREAMGFGDVTLMSMIGTFVGWQACLIIFFLAPFFGLLVGAAQWLLHRESEIYYGPFLCLATLTVIIRWAAIWDWALPMFAIGWLVPLAVIACLILMAALLSGWHGLLRLFGR